MLDLTDVKPAAGRLHTPKNTQKATLKSEIILEIKKIYSKRQKNEEKGK